MLLQHNIFIIKIIKQTILCVGSICFVYRAILQFSMYQILQEKSGTLRTVKNKCDTNKCVHSHVATTQSHRTETYDHSNWSTSFPFRESAVVIYITHFFFFLFVPFYPQRKIWIIHSNRPKLPFRLANVFLDMVVYGAIKIKRALLRWSVQITIYYCSYSMYFYTLWSIYMLN